MRGVSNKHCLLTFFIGSGGDQNSPLMHTPLYLYLFDFSFLDIKLHSDGGIPVDDFLGASKSLIPIFGRLDNAELHKY